MNNIIDLEEIQEYDDEQEALVKAEYSNMISLANNKDINSKYEKLKKSVDDLYQLLDKQGIKTQAMIDIMTLNFALDDDLMTHFSNISSSMKNIYSILVSVDFTNPALAAVYLALNKSYMTFQAAAKKAISDYNRIVHDADIEDDSDTNNNVTTSLDDL